MCRKYYLCTRRQRTPPARRYRRVCGRHHDPTYPIYVRWRVQLLVHRSPRRHARNTNHYRLRRG
ncbi:MAG: hypothetical protein CMP30_00180, partial [Roseibacillus sp.]|nr:hypothetical protein [Roseibacillus sp.]